MKEELYCKEMAVHGKGALKGGVEVENMKGK
jgi:hypothetical protein